MPLMSNGIPLRPQVHDPAFAFNVLARAGRNHRDRPIRRHLAGALSVSRWRHARQTQAHHPSRVGWVNAACFSCLLGWWPAALGQGCQPCPIRDFLAKIHTCTCGTAFRARGHESLGRLWRQRIRLDSIQDIRSSSRSSCLLLCCHPPLLQPKQPRDAHACRGHLGITTSSLRGCFHHPPAPTMRNTTHGLLLLVLTAFLSACGDSGGDLSYAELEHLAKAKESEANGFAANPACSRDSECGILLFADTYPTCSPYRYAPIAIIAEAAPQAFSAAAEQRAYAYAAVPLSGKSAPPCAPSAWLAPAPTPSCASNRCVLNSRDA